MNVTELVPLGKKRYKVILENKIQFALYAGEIRHYGIEEGKELSQEEWQEIKDEILKKRARERSMYLLKAMDYTEQEMRTKLAKNYYPQEVIEDVVEYLKGYHYLDDIRYIECYYRTYLGRKSLAAIRQALMKKGLSKELIVQVTEQCDEIREEIEDYPEEAMIRALLKKKKYSGDAADYKEKNRILGFLVRRGYKMEDVLHVMNHYQEE